MMLQGWPRASESKPLTLRVVRDRAVVEVEVTPAYDEGHSPERPRPCPHRRARRLPRAPSSCPTPRSSLPERRGPAPRRACRSPERRRLAPRRACRPPERRRPAPAALVAPPSAPAVPRPRAARLSRPPERRRALPPRPRSRRSPERPRSAPPPPALVGPPKAPSSCPPPRRAGPTHERPSVLPPARARRPPGRRVVPAPPPRSSPSPKLAAVLPPAALRPSPRAPSSLPPAALVAPPRAPPYAAAAAAARAPLRLGARGGSGRAPPSRRVPVLPRRSPKRSAGAEARPMVPRARLNVKHEAHGPSRSLVHRKLEHGRRPRPCRRSFARMSPSCATTMLSRPMESPSPVPCRSPFVSAEGVNACDRCSGAMPGPVVADLDAQGCRALRLRVDRRRNLPMQPHRPRAGPALRRLFVRGSRSLSRSYSLTPRTMETSCP